VLVLTETPKCHAVKRKAEQSRLRSNNQPAYAGFLLPEQLTRHYFDRANLLTPEN
jgi:hypothetical protein